ncbi:MAG: S8 family serine peptidase [Candidatus Tumulicola sp.]
MKISKHGRNALGAFAVVAMLADCNGSQAALSPSGPAGAAVLRANPRASTRATTALACVGNRYGVAQCDALVRTDVRPNAAPAGPAGGFAPADLQKAYNLPSASRGAGQIVAIVDAYDNPNVASDLAQYRAAFGLPPASFYKYNQDGQKGHYPAGDTGWGIEIDLDAEMVSAVCPNCTIDLVEANSNSWSDLEKAEAEAVTLGAHVVSNSAGGTGAKQKYFDTKGVTYVASSGDGGFGVGEPAAFDSVVAVGGTTLVQGGGGERGWTESAWSSSSGGCTSQPKPLWQHDRTCAFRLANDVSAVGDPNTGVAEYDTYGVGGWFVVGGTSVSAPLIAGIFGLAGNATKQDGGRTFWQKAHHPYLYRIQSGGKYVRYSTSGGWGTPDGIGAL